MSLNIFVILANSADPDEIPHVAVFHLGLLCLPIYLFTGPERKSQSIKNVLPTAIILPREQKTKVPISLCG